MEIWAHTMVKNEARWLWYSVSSIINHVDKLLLWDTGSTDGTIEIEKELVKKYSAKILYKQRVQITSSDFTKIRQEMLDETKSDWFLMVDGDEIWWNESINKVIGTIKSNESTKTLESVVVPTINVVGDIFHYQNSSAGRYRFGERVGHYNLRAINRNILGLHSQGEHGVWGWADINNRMIQERDSNKVLFVDAPYLHTTFLSRGSNRNDDKSVVKRANKLKYEIGKEFTKDFYYPEALFKDVNGSNSPWETMSLPFKFLSFIETPLRYIKRNVWMGRDGY